MTIPDKFIHPIRPFLTLPFRILSILTKPRMVWGYKDNKNGWCLRTRTSNTTLITPKSNLSMHDNVYVGHHTILDCTENITIHEGAQISSGVYIYTHSSHISIRLTGKHYTEIHESKKPGYIRGAVTIGAYAFLGAGSIIFPGVSVGTGSVVGAGAIVTKNVPDYSIVVGTPARVIGNVRNLDGPFLQENRILEWYTEWQSTHDV